MYRRWHFGFSAMEFNFTTSVPLRFHFAFTPILLRLHFNNLPPCPGHQWSVSNAVRVSFPPMLGFSSRGPQGGSLHWLAAPYLHFFRTEKLGSLAASRGSQRGFKIAFFRVETWTKGAKVVSRMHLAQVSNFLRILFPFWFLLCSIRVYKNNDKWITVCNLNVLACWRWGCILGSIFEIQGIQSGSKVATKMYHNGIQRLDKGLQDGVRKRYEKTVQK